MTWRVQLYPITTGQAASTLKTLHYGTITALACSPNARYIASADQIRQLSVWDVQAAIAKPLPTSLPVIVAGILATGRCSGGRNGM